jgi:hypothetical protein
MHPAAVVHHVFAEERLLACKALTLSRTLMVDAYSVRNVHCWLLLLYAVVNE